MADLIKLYEDHRHVCQAAGIMLLLSVLFYRYIQLVLVVWSFIGGLLLCSSTLRPDSLLPNLLRWHVRKKKLRDGDDELTLLKRVCPVCGKVKCSRHRPELNIVALQPWTNLKVPEKVDTALEEFLNLVVKDFIYTWYRDLSEDEAFVDEFRHSLRFIVAVLLRRLQKVDLPSLILGKILKAAIQHLHIYLQVRKKVREGVDLEHSVLEDYGPHLHCGARNRKAELDYLRHTAERLFPYILPHHSLQCKSLVVLLKEIVSGAILLPVMDKLAEPDMVNNLLLVFFDNSPPPVCHDPPSPDVSILANFGQPLSKNDSCLHLELSDLLGSPDNLYPFMQFMKSEGSVNVLQFYLSVEEFNAKILTPELTQSQQENLQMELQDLYRMYLDPAAADRIQFEDDIISQVKTVCDGPPEGVLTLQRTTPLFRAYEHTYNLLENTFLPLFHQSDDYYKFLCGERLPSSFSRSGSRASRRGADPLTLSKIGNKIKGVFRSQTVEGKLLDDIDYAEEETDSALNKEDEESEDEDGSGPSSLPMEDTIPAPVPVPASISTQPANGQRSAEDFEETLTYHRHFLLDGPLHDLSAWRVTIPQIIAKPEPDNTKKFFFLFVIEVRRIDVLEKQKMLNGPCQTKPAESNLAGLPGNDFEASNWIVERRYSEFYVLEQKLAEFHGEFEDALLPPKKAFGTKNKEFLESKQAAFEQYLQKLLTKPTLRGSELLYSFLTSECEFTTSFLADINLGKMVKSGAMKLVKERGQHLDPFLQSLLLSTETSKPRPCKMWDSDSDTISISSEKMANSIYENNANIGLDLSPTTPLLHAPGMDHRVEGLMDTVLYLSEHVFEVPDWLHSLLLVGRQLGRNTLDSWIDWYLGYKLDKVMQDFRLVRLVHLLRDALFFDTDPPRTDEEKKQRRKETLVEWKKFIPSIFAHAMGPEKFHPGAEAVFELLQMPKLNKQLSYMLLDILLEELFPELLSAEDHPRPSMPHSKRPR